MVSSRKIVNHGLLIIFFGLLFGTTGIAQDKEDRKLYDSVILIDNKGKILLKHQKINILTNLMTPPYTA